MYTLVCTWHTYALKKSSFDDFHVFEEYWAWMSIFMIMCFTLYLYTHFIWWFLMILFSWVWYVPYGFWVFSDHVIYIVSWKKYFCFIPCLKDFVLVNKFFHLTSYGILHFGRDFQTSHIFKSIFENPYLPRAVGWEIMLMYAL